VNIFTHDVSAFSALILGHWTSETASNL